jgi:molybdenum cofactor cytidylyltransferase
MLAAVILAAGESQRMGQPKALLAYRGLTFVEHLIEATRHARVGVTRIVLGAGAKEIQTHLRADAACIVVNQDWPKGQLSSVQAALRSFPPAETDGMILCPVDFPLVSAEIVAQLIEKFDSSGNLIVLPSFNGRRGHPVVFHATLYDELLAASPQVGARQVVWDHAKDVAEVPTEEEGVILNLNDPETLSKALGALRPPGL